LKDFSFLPKGAPYLVTAGGKLTRPILTLGAAALVFAFASPAKADDEPTVVLRVDSPRKVAVEDVDTGAILCHSPCNTAVPATARYRIAGSRPSETFTLASRNGAATIAVDPASERGLVAGLAVGGAGAALATAGAIVLGVATAERDETPLAGSDGVTTENGFSDAMYAGTVMVIAGLAGAIWGGAHVLNNWKTTVSGNVVKQTPPAQAFMFPIIGGSF
jgi:hypothetical protein